MKPLRGYSRLLALVYERRDMGDLRKAIDEAIDQCIEDGCLVDYLTKHRAEAGDLLFTEFVAERAMRLHHEVIRRDATVEGLAEGGAEERKRILEQLRANGVSEDLLAKV